MCITGKTPNEKCLLEPPIVDLTPAELVAEYQEGLEKYLFVYRDGSPLNSVRNIIVTAQE